MWGHELEALLTTSEIDDKLFIFPDLKMCLYENELHVGSNHRIENELERLRVASNGHLNLTVDDLIARHLHAILNAAISAVETAEKGHGTFSREEIRAMRRHCIFTVPEITTLQSNRRFASMIKSAGFPKKIAMIAETEAATAKILQECGSVDGQACRGLRVRSYHTASPAVLLTGCRKAIISSSWMEVASRSSL